MELLKKGVINLELKDIEKKDMKKLTDIFITLIDNQVHRIRNGKVTLHFDGEGKFRKLVVESVLWKS